MKTIAQLLQLSKNRFYKFTQEEQQVLDDFLANKLEQEDPLDGNLTSSSKKTRAIVKNKNIVVTEHGEIPTE